VRSPGPGLRHALHHVVHQVSTRSARVEVSIHLRQFRFGTLPTDVFQNFIIQVSDPLPTRGTFCSVSVDAGLHVFRAGRPEIDEDVIAD
jgi:hypothetical protein